MWEAKINKNSEYQLVPRPTTKLENLALSVNRNYLTNVFVSTVILIIPCIVSFELIYKLSHYQRMNSSTILFINPSWLLHVKLKHVETNCEWYTY